MDFFILGNPRSGTTLLRLMLNNHPLIGVPPESGFLHWWYKKYQSWQLSDSTNTETLQLFLDDILSSKKIEEWKLDRKELEKFISNAKPKNYLEIINCIYKFHCQNKSIIGDKNNYYIQHLEELKEIAPNAKYIHLIRDGRDVACSYMHINKLDPSLKYLPKVSSEIEEIAQEWTQNVTRIEAFAKNNTSITIRYEDLIVYPKESLSKICDFLGVSFSEDMLQYHAQAIDKEPKSTIIWKKKVLQEVDKNNQGKYLKVLSKDEINKFNAIAKTTLLKFNY